MHPEEFRVTSFRDLSSTTLYAILKLRVDVFVVEQQCPYPELDGRDAEPGTRHVWLSRDDKILAYLRILDDGDTERIGRVVTARAARKGGYGSRLMEHALTIIGNRPSVLDAQAHLTGFYAKFGFTESGPRYVEDGIPHVPMARPQGRLATSSVSERRRPV
ncbi:GNAT family N-acetyltransferase [Actinoplanes sp. TFC3]|uniref:GNAT family N-acetyltransferase n=1 Tax=Actinoplanes sp. TFC3 TaxID=1710355 RepID=UPI0008327DF1|nr:GNAT family N-acetyltransferase [Actinoplanes sp. TFC3]